MRLSATDHTHHAFLAAAYAWLGDKTAAAAHADRVRSLDPGFALADFLGTMHYADTSDLEHLRQGLERAGVS